MRYHVIRLTRSVTRGRWAVAYEVDRWCSGALDLAIVVGQDRFYSAVTAHVKAQELEAAWQKRSTSSR